MIKVSLVPLIFLANAFATSLDGPVDLQGQTHESLTIYGDAFMRDMKVKKLQVHGNLQAIGLESTSIRVSGSMEGERVQAKRLDASGDLTLVQSEIEEVFSLSNSVIKGLKSNAIYLFSAPDQPVYGLRSDTVVVKTKERANLKIGDACYINVIRFEGVPGDVSLMKDRSYIGDVENGSRT